MGTTRGIRLLALTGVMGTFLMGCSGAATRESESIGTIQKDPGVIGLVPFSLVRSDIPTRNLVRCPGCEGYTAVGEVGPEGPEIITNLFRRRLISNGYSLVSQEIVAKALSDYGRLEERPEALAQRLAPELTADSVLMGWVFRYRERVGSAWGVQQPASVAFVAVLIDGGTGTLLWRRKFDETQQPLSENVLNAASFIRRGGRWLTAKQLAADGVGRVLLTFPGEETMGVNR